MSNSNDISPLAILIPTCSKLHEDIRIGYVLQSLAQQPKSLFYSQFDIFIWDEGDTPIVSDRWVRLIIDLLGECGHKVNYLRRTPSHGVAMARRSLIESIPESYSKILMIDDDLLVLPGAVNCILEAESHMSSYGFLQGTKIELDKRRVYQNDINKMNEVVNSDQPIRLYFGDGAFLLVHRDALKHIQWDVVTRFQEEGLAGEDVTITLMVADKMDCYGVPQAIGYHMSLSNPRWKWETSSDLLQFEMLKGIVSEKTIKSAMPHLSRYL